jgi:DUF917 family protein
MRKISLDSAEELEDLVRGCAFMGTGGGGSPEKGLKLLRRTVAEGKKIRLIHPGEVPDDAWICTGAYVGSIAPRTPEDLQIIERLGLTRRVKREIVRAVQELEEYAGLSIHAIAPTELGGLNTPAPLDAAAILEIPSIDGDFGGRALPESTQFRFSLAGMKIWPRVFCDFAGDITIIKEAATSPMMERIQKHVSMSSLGLVGAAGHLMRGKEMKEVILPGTVSRCISIGAAIRRARGEKEGLTGRVAEAVDGWVLFQGRVSEKTWESLEGYMIGHIELTGEGPFQGQTFRIWFKNEYHVSWLNQEPFVTSPDIISVLNLDSEEVPTNTDIDQGDRLGVIGSGAAEGYRTKKGLEVLGPSHFGFALEYVPIEQRIASKRNP